MVYYIIEDQNIAHVILQTFPTISIYMWRKSMFIFFLCVWVHACLLFQPHTDVNVSLADVLMSFNMSLISPEMATLIQDLQIPLDKVQQIVVININNTAVTCLPYKNVYCNKNCTCTVLNAKFKGNYRQSVNLQNCYLTLISLQLLLQMHYTLYYMLY